MRLRGRLDRLRARRAEAAAPKREPVTEINVKVIQFPGWDTLAEQGWKPGDDRLWLR